MLVQSAMGPFTSWKQQNDIQNQSKKRISASGCWQMSFVLLSLGFCSNSSLNKFLGTWPQYLFQDSKLLAPVFCSVKLNNGPLCTVVGLFSLQDLIISQVINHVTCYRCDSSHWLKLQHSDQTGGNISTNKSILIDERDNSLNFCSARSGTQLHRIVQTK